MIHSEDARAGLQARILAIDKNFIQIEKEIKYSSKIQRAEQASKAFSSETRFLKNDSAKAKEQQIKRNFEKIKNIVLKEYSRHYSSGVSGQTSSGSEEQSDEKSEIDFTREDPYPR